MQKNRLVLIVEGPGDEKAVPALIRQILHTHLFAQPLAFTLQVKAINANGKGNITTNKATNGIEKYLSIARTFSDCVGCILVLDADKEDRDCPVELATQLAKRAEQLNLPFPVSIVVAVCEYESWFLHNLSTIAPKYLTDSNTQYDGDAELECSAKGWLTRHMDEGKIYREELQQVKMTYDIDIPHTINQSRSFRRMVHAVEELLNAINNGETTVTPITS